MKKYILLLFVATWALYAQVPATLNYHGILADDDSNVMDGTNTAIFRIFDSAADGTELWNETQTITTTDGHFELELGSINPINLDFSIPYYLELTIDGETLTPRERLATVSYARRAVVSNTADSSVYSVSSSIDHTGRVGHMRFIPGDGGSITEALETSDTDTIYIAIGGSSGGASSSYPMANKVFGENTRHSSNYSNTFYIVPTNKVFYIYGAELTNAPTYTGYASNEIYFNDGTGNSQIIHSQGEAYNDGVLPAIVKFDPPIRIEEGTTLTYSFTAYATNYFLHGYSLYGWEGTE